MSKLRKPRQTGFLQRKKKHESSGSSEYIHCSETFFTRCWNTSDTHFQKHLIGVFDWRLFVGKISLPWDAPKNLVHAKNVIRL